MVKSVEDWSFMIMRSSSYCIRSFSQMMGEVISIGRSENFMLELKVRLKKNRRERRDTKH